jgi:hypothetical protein
VQARRLRRIDPRLSVRGVVSRLEDVPLGWLRGDVLLACVDSRAARRVVNTLAWRLGVPAWIDAGVHGDALLARVNVYRTAPEQPCLECAWDDSDYAMLEETYACGASAPAPTRAPAALGALAASLQAIECRKVLAGRWEQALVGRQAAISAETHRLQVTAFRPNARCRFDHETWAIADLEGGPDQLTLAGLFEGADEIRVAGQLFARRLTCPSCGAVRETSLRLAGRAARTARTCACGGALRPTGFDSLEWLRPEAVSSEERETPLDRLGLVAGDVLSVRAADRTTHHQIGGRR